MTEAALYREQYTVPFQHRPRLQARDIEVLDDAGTRLGAVRVNGSGAMHGLNRLLPDLKTADYILVKIVGDAISVGVCKLPVSEVDAADDDYESETLPTSEGEVHGTALPPSNEFSAQGTVAP